MQSASQKHYFRAWVFYSRFVLHSYLIGDARICIEMINDKNRSEAIHMNFITLRMVDRVLFYVTCFICFSFFCPPKGILQSHKNATIACIERKEFI